MEKVRDTCRESFQSLGGTSKEFRDSARKCTRTLVVTPSKAVEKRTVKKSSRDSSLSTRLNKYLLEEIKKRPGISDLVMSEPGFLKRGGRFSILTSLSSVPWASCTMLGRACNGHKFFAWDGSFCERVLSGSKQSLTKLSMVSFDFEGSTLLQLGQHFPKLAALKVDSKIYKSYQACTLPQHDKLLRLDIATIGPFKEIETHRMSTGGKAPRCRTVSAQTDHRCIWPPNVKHLTVAAFCAEDPTTKILISIPLAGLSSLPYSLETLELWNCPGKTGITAGDTGLQKFVPYVQYWRHQIAHCFKTSKCAPIQA